MTGWNGTMKITGAAIALVTAAFTVDSTYVRRSDAQQQYQKLEQSINRQAVQLQILTLENRAGGLEREQFDLQNAATTTGQAKNRLYQVTNELTRLRQQITALEHSLAGMR